MTEFKEVVPQISPSADGLDLGETIEEVLRDPWSILPPEETTQYLNRIKFDSHGETIMPQVEDWDPIAFERAVDAVVRFGDESERKNEDKVKKKHNKRKMGKKSMEQVWKNPKWHEEVMSDLERNPIELAELT